MADLGGFDPQKLMMAVMMGRGGEALSMLKSLDVDTIARLVDAAKLSASPEALHEAIAGSGSIDVLLSKVEKDCGLSLGDLASMATGFMGRKG